MIQYVILQMHYPWKVFILKISSLFSSRKLFTCDAIYCNIDRRRFLLAMALCLLYITDNYFLRKQTLYLIMGQ
jgi:hypothetical protein